MNTPTPTPWETSAAQALWAYAALQLNAGALGLLEVELVTAPGPRLWTDGRTLRVSRQALHDWLAVEDIGRGGRALANAGLLLLEEWLREAAGWPIYPMEDTAPVVALPEGEWAPEFGRALRQRLRYPKKPMDPVQPPAGLEASLTQWSPSTQQWGRAEVEDRATIATPARTWTVTEAQAVWRQSQCEFRQAHGPLEYTEEMALTGTLLTQFPQLAGQWFGQSPVPKAPWDGLFLVQDPQWVPALIEGGAHRDAEHLGDGLLFWACLHAPQLIRAFLANEVPLNAPESELLWRLAIFEDPSELEVRKQAAMELLERVNHGIPTTSFITHALTRAFYPKAARLDLLRAVWPEGQRLEDVLPTLEVEVPEMGKSALPLPIALAVLMVEAIQFRECSNKVASQRMAQIAEMGVDFSATFENGDSVFHLPMSVGRMGHCAEALYFSLTPLGADWSQLNTEGKHPLDLPYFKGSPKMRSKQRNSYTLKRVEADLEAKRLNQVLEQSQGPSRLRSRL